MATGTKVSKKRTFDITPTWEDSMPVLIDILKNNYSTESAKNECASEIMRLARNMDKVIEEKKGEK
tara:strand:- start:17 stop:214 length:198 start_codon:yes stop_codon:yes gene_type:complete